MPLSLVTGASRGLGLALARSLVADGWSVVVDGRDAGDLARAAALLEADAAPTARVTALPGDIADPSHRAEMIAAAERAGGVDLLVNNAGALGPSPLLPVGELRPADLEDLYRVNVVAPLALAAAALPSLRRRRGRIVNITSDAAVECYPGWGAYGSSKAALEQASLVMAAEETEVRVYVVDPGDMRTRMHQDAFPGEDISDRPLPEDEAVPALRRLIAGDLAAGRYRASDLLTAVAR